MFSFGLFGLRNRLVLRRTFSLGLIFASIFGAQAAAEPLVVLPVESVRTGDLDEILEARQFRLIVPYSKTHFFFDKGHERGVAAEFGREFETWLNKRHARKGLPIRVVFVPTARDRLFDALLAGKGDAVSAGLTITQERLRRVDFVRPWLTGVAEILVSGPKAPPVTRLDDLAGRDLPVRPGTSFREHLEATNRDFVARGLTPIRIVELSPRLQSEDVLQMVAAGLLPWAIADSHIAEHWSRALSGLKTHPDIVFNRGGEIAWALRKDSPKLAAELDAFFAERKAGTAFGSTVLRRYFGGRAAVRDVRAADGRFDKLIDSFQRHAEVNGMDFLLLAAQGFQESRLDQDAVSRRGAVGIMQLLPSTAQAPPISIKGVERDADANIRAGAAVMAHLRSRHVNQPGLDEIDRTLMTFAAYNAGPGNLRKFRRKAAAMGLDPDVWFENVEIAAARIVGAETVNYVSNIYKYYVAYSLAMTEDQTRHEFPGQGIERVDTSP
jgi:membrane-bound lytic murein transglycosylase MltF